MVGSAVQSVCHCGKPTSRCPGHFWSKSLLLIFACRHTIFNLPFLNDDNFLSFIFSGLVFANQPTSLLCIIEELVGEGSMAVTTCLVTGDKWQVAGDMWHVTYVMWHVTYVMWHVTCDTQPQCIRSNIHDHYTVSYISNTATVEAEEDTIALCLHSAACCT